MSFLNLGGVVDGTLGGVINWWVQSTLLIVVGLAVAAALRQKGAAVQSAVYRITLVAVLVAPVATWIWSGAGVTGWSLQPAVAAAPAPSAARATHPAGTPRQVESEVLPMGETPAIAEGEAGPGATAVPETRVQSAVSPDGAKDVAAGGGWPVGFVIGLIWAAGSGWLLFRLLKSARALSRLRGSAVPADAGALALLRQLSAERGLRAPDLLRTPLIESACLAGVRRPVIFLPEETMALPLREVLVHELGHLRRRDCLWHWIAQVAVAVFFFQPLLWVLARRMEAVAEEVCDNCVVEAGVDSREYATHLVELAEQSHEPLCVGGIGIVPVRSLLPGRIRCLLDPKGVRSTFLSRRARLAVMGGGLAAAVLAGFVGATGNVEPDGAREAVSEGQVIRGVLRNATGKPLANSPVYLVARVAHWEPSAAGRRTSKPAILDVAQTDHAGRFEVVAPSDSDREVAFHRLVAVPSGHGIAFGPYLGDLDEEAGRTHEVVADEAIPITGRLLSPEGEPVRGATVSLTAISAQYPSEEWDAIGVFSLGWADPVFEFWPAPMKTDADGRFNLRVSAAESVARLLIEADGHAPARVVVVPPEIKPAFSEKNRLFPYREEIVDPEFSYVLEPARVFEGTVTDARTGDVLEGATVGLRGSWFGPIEWEHTAVTDSGGRYRIETASAFYYSTMTRAEGYIGTEGHIIGETVESEIAADGMVRRDIELTPAVRVRGLVVDGPGGNGIAGAAVTYRPVEENPFKQRSHAFWDDIVLTDADGRFVISAVPGTGYLLAEADSDEYIRAVFPGSWGDTFPHGFIEIDVPATETWEAPPVSLQKGVGIEVEAVGPNGEAVDRLHVATLETSATMTHADLIANRSPYRGGKHRLTGLSPSGTYRTFFYSPDLNAGAAIDLRYDSPRAEPRQVRLQPAATVRARLVFEDGTPARNLRVNAGFVATADDPEKVDFFSDASLQNMAPGQMGDFRTDDNGEFEINRFIPGTYVIISLNKPNFSDGTRGRRVGELSPGEVRDLGTLELKAPEQ